MGITYEHRIYTTDWSMNSRLKCLGLVLLFFPWIQSCVYTPSEAQIQPYAAQCEMITRKLQVESHDIKQCSGKSCLVIAGVITPMSAIVSGSIVLVGNTLHWAEYSSSCSAEEKNYTVKL